MPIIESNHRNVNWRKCKYGKITGSQLERAIATLEECWAMRADLAAHIRNDGFEDAIVKLVKVPIWTRLYEESFGALVLKIGIISGIDIESIGARTGELDVVETVWQEIEKIAEVAPDHPAALPLAFALIGNLEAIARYSRSINDMLVACRERGDIEALFQALSIDSYLLASPFFLGSLRLGQIAGDVDMAEAVSKALKGPHKKRLIYPTLRWAEYILREQGAFEACTQDEIHDLIVVRLKLYDDDTKLKNSKKALFTLFDKWRAEAGI